VDGADSACEEVGIDERAKDVGERCTRSVTLDCDCQDGSYCESHVRRSHLLQHALELRCSSFILEGLSKSNVSMIRDSGRAIWSIVNAI